MVHEPHRHCGQITPEVCNDKKKFAVDGNIEFLDKNNVRRSMTKKEIDE